MIGVRSTLETRIIPNRSKPESSFLCKGSRYGFKGFCEGFYGELFSTANLYSVLSESLGEFRLRRAAASNYLSVLQRVSHHAQCVVQRSVRFVDNVFCSSAYYYGDRLRVLGVANVQELVVADLDLLYRLGLSERVLCEVFDAGNDSCACRL